MAVGDTIPLVGKIDLIDSKQVIINTDNGPKTYPTPGNEPISFNALNRNGLIRELTL